MSEWQPIETAPTDGRKVRVLNNQGEEDRAHWTTYSLSDGPVIRFAERGLLNENGEWSADKGLGPFAYWAPEDER